MKYFIVINFIVRTGKSVFFFENDIDILFSTFNLPDLIIELKDTYDIDFYQAILTPINTNTKNEVKIKIEKA